jgi:hypothetical protein
MIHIFRSDYDSAINFFHNRKYVNRDEVIIKKRGDYTYAEPTQQGDYAFGGTLLYTDNGIFPEFNTPIKLHDRIMTLESRPIKEKYAVKCTYENGDTIITGINGTKDQANEYFLNRVFNIGSGENDNLQKCIAVEFLEDN